MRIEDIDRNMKVASSLELEDIVWFDVRKAPFEIYGLFEPQSAAPFRRMPQSVADAANAGIAQLNLNTAGGRIRFSTDSDVVALKSTAKSLPLMSHIARSGQSGFDLYCAFGDEKMNFKGSFRPATNYTDGFETYVDCSRDGKLLQCEINMPPYGNVDELYLGFRKGSTLDVGRKYPHLLPIVFLGSSITQGGCVSRPGNAFVPMISRDLDTDVINLGFSGSCHGETALVDHIAGLPMSLFVCDYDHNASGPDQLRETHLPLYKRFRAAQPDTPVLFITKPDWINDPLAFERRKVIFETCLYALGQGDENVYFLDGETLWNGVNKNDCTVDTCHPNDLGHYRMAQVIGEKINSIIHIK